MERGDETRRGRKKRDPGSRPGPSARDSSSCGEAAGEESSGRAKQPGDTLFQAPGAAAREDAGENSQCDVGRRGLRQPLAAQGGAEAQAPAAPPGAGPSFEDEFAATEKSVDALERGDLSLEESLRAYEEGLRALKACYDVLQRAQRRIEVLGREIGAVMEDSDAPFWKPATSSPSLSDVMDRVDREGELPPATPSPGRPAPAQESPPGDSEDP